MSINQLFDITRRSFRTLNAAMNTVGQNVANAETEGYHRRTVTFRSDAIASSGILIPMPRDAATGAGVSIQEYDRARDSLLAASANEARAALGSAEEQQRLLSALKSIFPAGEGSIHSLLGSFWDAWANVADHPTEPGVRIALRDQAVTLSGAFRRADEDLSLLEDEATATLEAHVGKVNDLLGNIADLNVTIEAARSRGAADLAAEDERDLLVKQLAEFVPVRVRENELKGITVAVGGMTVVDGKLALGFDLDTSGSPPQLTFKETQVAYNPPSGNDGKLGASLRFLTDTVPATRTSLNTLATTLVEEVNELHNTGYGLDNGTGRNFFDPAGTSAASIGISTDVANDTRAIAASGAANAPGDSVIALRIADLRTQKLFNGATETTETFTASFVSGIGSQARQATSRMAGQAAVVDHLHALEQGVSGVSLDEEMTNLIKYQQAFAATARVLDTAQQMMDTLLAL